MGSPDIRQIAQAYISAGWAVVPLVKGEKRAESKWNKKTYGPKNFGPNDNIALKCGAPSGNRVDVDLDAVEAVEAGKLLLPQTGLVHGRPGKPESHLWYLCPDVKSFVWKDIKDTGGQTGTLLEIRSTGGYTMAPPSVHPSGEVVAWALERDPLVITLDDLMRAGHTVGITALLARHWPGPGARHHFAGHLAGFLCRHLEPRFVVPIIHAAATIAKDPDVKDRIVFARNTIDKFQRDPDAVLTGGPKLADDLGEDVVTRLRSWLGARDEDALEALNQRHFFVTMGTNSVIGREDKLDRKDGQVLFQKPRELYSEYANQRVQVGTDKKGEPQYKNVFEAWLEWRGRRDYSGVVFSPPPQQDPEKDYNLWKGFAVEPVPPAPITNTELEAFQRGAYAPGRIFRLLHHLRHVIADGDPLYYDTLLNWLADLVQSPGVVPGTSHVWLGEEGTGKNAVIEAICGLFHPSMVFSGASDLVVGKFNACTRNRVFINVNESDGKKLKKNLDRLKMIITEPTMWIEPKGVDAHPVDNFAHVIFTTNGDEHGNVDLPAHVGQRRLVFQRVSHRYAQGRCADAERAAYFEPLWAEVQDRASLGALLWFLQARDLSDYNRYAKLVTDEEVRQRALGMTGPLRWLWDLVALGRMPNVSLDPKTKEVAIGLVYTVYVEWAKQHDEKPIGPGPWGKAVAPFLWASSGRSNTERWGVLVTITELEKRLRAAKSAPTAEDELIWSRANAEGSRVTPLVTAVTTKPDEDEDFDLV